MKKRDRLGFTLIETLLALFLVGLVMGLVGLLFHRSFQMLRVLDAKERARQAGRMGLDRITSELREAVSIQFAGDSRVEFTKIDPAATSVPPPPAPTEAELRDGYEPDFLPWGLNQAYPKARRLEVRYSLGAVNDNLLRKVTSGETGNTFEQVVVSGINKFVCTTDPDRVGEVTVLVTVFDGSQVKTLKSVILCPCIHEDFK